MTLKCDDCETIPQRIVSWQKKNRCPQCDEKRRRKEIEAAGTIIDDSGVACVGCLFGIRLVDLHTADGDGPYHRECALANAEDPKTVRLAPDEFLVIERETFEARGQLVKPETVN